jgi:hypothetical protein
MDKILSSTYLRKNAFGYLIDILAVLCVYFIPTLSHLTGVPFYMFEPMRVFILLALLHSNKLNAYILALTLPIFSFVIASHPFFLKSILMSIELVLNVFLYYFLTQRKLAAYLSVFFSVILSKAAYYLLKFICIQLMFFQSDMVSTPIYVQFIITAIFSLYAFVLFKNQNIRVPKDENV